MDGKTLKILWISRHPLDSKAETAILKFANETDYFLQIDADSYTPRKVSDHNERNRSAFTQTKVDIKDFVFSEQGEDALEELSKLVDEDNYNFVGGVFPSQLWLSLVNVSSQSWFFPCIFVVVSKSVAGEDGKTRTFQFDHCEYLDRSDKI